MRYKYQATDEQSQTITGVLTADNERAAMRQLQKRGLMVVTIAPLTADTLDQRRAQQRPPPRDILIVLHELSTLLESDVSLIEAIESLANSSHHPFLTQAFAQMAQRLRQGVSFSVILKDSALNLPWYIHQLIEAGELTGKVANALRDGVEQMEYEARVRNELRNAMIYPVILIFSGITAVVLIFTLVVPRFANILQNRGDEIPLLAQWVLGTGMFFNHHFDSLVIGLVVSVIVGGYLLNQAHIRARLHNSLANLPILGSWLLESETSRWAAMMGTLLENRVSLLRALELASQGVKLPSLLARLQQVTRAVRAGTSLSQALQDNDALTPTGHNLIRAGEKAGQLPRMLRSLARLLEESGRVRMKRFLLLIEPIAILLIGGVIGVIITGVILAITSVNDIAF
jgi:general secretion pathway protein F